MAIAIDCRSVFPGRGGIGRYAESLARLLPRLDRKNYVLFTTQRQQEKICLEREVQQIAFPCGMIDSFWEQIHLPRLLSEYEIELYHNPCFSLPIAISNTRLVTTIHDVVFRERPDLVEEKLCQYLDRWTQVASQVADCVITVSEYSKKQLMRYYGIESRKVEVIYNGLDPKFQRAPDWKQDQVRNRYGLPKDFILYLGAIEPKKNLDLVLEAMRIVKEKEPQCPLVIAGGQGSIHYDLENAMRRCGLEKSVIVVGYVEENEVVALLSAARIFVYPSLYEGFGFPPLEAMACETPTIVSDGTSLPEIVGDGAVIVGSKDHEGLAAAIHTLLSDEEERNSWAARGKRRAAFFNWQECAAKTFSMYQRTLA